MMVYKATSSLLIKEGDMPKFLRSEFKDLKVSIPLTRDELRITKVMYLGCSKYSNFRMSAYCCVFSLLML